MVCSVCQVLAHAATIGTRHQRLKKIRRETLRWKEITFITLLSFCNNASIGHELRNMRVQLEVHQCSLGV